MVSIYDCCEPTIVTEQLLQRAVEEQRPEGEAGRIALQDGIKFSEVKTLVLSFKNILQIENLWNFGLLVRLQLDNNVIEKIEGLDSLVNLKWLDLSFNNIEVINGLNNLMKLEDLSLYNNHIRTIENLDNLQKLQVFSIGNNLLSELETLLELRKNKSLKTLNTKGNPFYMNPNYKIYIAAFLPNITNLDYHLINEETRAEANDRYSTLIEAMASKDKSDQTQLIEKEKEDKTVKLYEDAGVLGYHSTTLFDSMFSGDRDVLLCLSLEGADKAYNNFREIFLEVCKVAFDHGLKEHHKRQNEVELFVTSLRDALASNQRHAVYLVDQFLIEKEKALNRVKNAVEQNENSSDVKTEVMAQQEEALSLLKEQLMENELFVADQIDDALRDFERILNDLSVTSMDVIRTYGTHMRDMENQFNEQLLEIAITFMDKIVKEEEIVLDHMKDLFSDKDTVFGSLSGSHDMRMVKIDKVEDKTVNTTKNWTYDVLGDFQNEEIQRNRKRILEITHFIEFHRKDTQDIQRIRKETKSSLFE